MVDYTRQGTHLKTKQKRDTMRKLLLVLLTLEVFMCVASLRPIEYRNISRQFTPAFQRGVTPLSQVLSALRQYGVKERKTWRRLR